MNPVDRDRIRHHDRLAREFAAARDTFDRVQTTETRDAMYAAARALAATGETPVTYTSSEYGRIVPIILALVVACVLAACGGNVATSTDAGELVDAASVVDGPRVHDAGRDTPGDALQVDAGGVDAFPVEDAPELDAARDSLGDALQVDAGDAGCFVPCHPIPGFDAHSNGFCPVPCADGGT